MCRWLVWCSSEPICLAEVVLECSNSLLVQSFEAGFHPGLNDKNNMSLNADGFGVGWYGARGAAIFRSVLPAWTNRNLRELCGSITSKCIFAHVRAATPDSVVAEENCHPFRYGPLLFQHNGHVEGFEKIKRRIMNALPDELYNWVSGTTDSEACFALLLSQIDPASIESGSVSIDEMQEAVLTTIEMLREFLAEAGVTTGYSTFNFALTDGERVVVTRYCDKAPRIPPPSLYYAFLPCSELRTHLLASKGSAPRGPAYGLGRRGAGNTADAPVSRRGSADLLEQCEGGAFICASEPLTRNTERWHLIEENSMICYQQDSSGAVPAVSAVPAAATVLAVPEVQHNPETLPTVDAADAADAAGALLGAGIPLSRGRALSEGELTLTSARTQCAQLQLGPVHSMFGSRSSSRTPSVPSSPKANTAARGGMAIASWKSRSWDGDLPQAMAPSTSKPTDEWSMRRATDVQRLAVSLNAGARATPPIDATCDALSDDFSPESAEADADDSTEQHSATDTPQRSVPWQVRTVTSLDVDALLKRRASRASDDLSARPGA